jgi:hypothetical protein
MRKRYVRMCRVTESSPLVFLDRLVYSVVAQRSTYQRWTGSRTLWRLTGIDRASARSVLARLSEYGLVQKKTGRWYACAPPAAVGDWFQYPAKLAHLPQWFLRLGYDKVYLPAPAARLTIRVFAVHSMMLRCGPKAKTIARRLGLARNTVRDALRKLAKIGPLPDHYFQAAGSKVGARAPSSKLPADYITRILLGAGISAVNVSKLHPRLLGVPAARLEELVNQCSREYDKTKYEDCSYLLGFKIKKLDLKPVMPTFGPTAQARVCPPAWQKLYDELGPGLIKGVRSGVTDEISDPCFWMVRVRRFNQYEVACLRKEFGDDRLGKVIAALEPVYWEDMPGMAYRDRERTALDRRPTFEDLRKILSRL